MVEDHAAGDDASGVAAKVFEEGELLLGELELGASAMCFAADQVELEIGDTQAGGLGLIGRATPEKGTQAGDDFGDGEGLGEVVVASALKAEDTLIDRTARGKNEHGRGDSLGAEPMDEVEAVHVGEGQVDDHGVVYAFKRPALRLVPTAAGIDPEAGFVDGPGEKFTNCTIVFDYQQPQANPVSLFQTLITRAASSNASC